MLEGLGHTIAAGAGQLDQALELARSAEFNLAIVDVNLKGRVISPVAELIVARALPSIFATGCGSAGLPEGFRDRPALQKPFELKVLTATIEGIFNAQSAQAPSNAAQRTYFLN
jgi:DNA-binding response OmpR family regulator